MAVEHPWQALLEPDVPRAERPEITRELGGRRADGTSDGVREPLLDVDGRGRRTGVARVAQQEGGQADQQHQHHQYHDGGCRDAPGEPGLG